MGRYAFSNCTFLTICCERSSKPNDWSSYWNNSNCKVYWNAKKIVINEIIYIYSNSNSNAIIIGYTKDLSTQVVIPETITVDGMVYDVITIANDAFKDRAFLTSITIPSSVITIGEYAFYNCESLTSITIPSSVTTIGSYALAWCTSLTSITILSGVTSIGDRTFYKCTSLTNIIIPNSVTTIGRYAFAYCTSLISITISSSLKIIEECAFLNCASLTSITIPSSVTTIEDSAFFGCELLTIYCDISCQPSGWSSNWNPDNCKVVWNNLGCYKTI